MTHSFSFTDISIFSSKVSKVRHVEICSSFDFIGVLKGRFNKSDCNFDDISKIGYSSQFRKKGYDVVTSVCDVTNKILSSDSNCIVDVVILPKPGNSNISMREVIIASNL